MRDGAVAWLGAGAQPRMPAPAMAELARLAAQAARAPAALLCLTDGSEGTSRIAAATGLSAFAPGLSKAGLPASIHHSLADLAGPIAIADTGVPACRAAHPALAEAGIAAFLGVPVHGPDGAVEGVLAVADSYRRLWAAADRAGLSDLSACIGADLALRASMADLSAAHTDLRRAHTRLARSNALRETVLLSVMAPDLSAAQRLSTLLRGGAEALGLTAAAILQLDGGEVHRLVSAGPLQPSALGLTRRVFSEERLICVADTAAPDAAVPEGCGARAYAGVALCVAGRPFGVLEFRCTRPRRQGFDDADQSLLMMLGLIAGAHLEMEREVHAAWRRTDDLLCQSARHRDNGV